jgi:hypothetical protein
MFPEVIQHPLATAAGVSESADQVKEKDIGTQNSTKLVLPNDKLIICTKRTHLSF